MPVDRATVFTTCDQLALSGERVAFREVYRRHGGNHQQVLQWWREWMDQHQPQPGLLPETFVESLQRFLLADLWEARYQTLTQQLVPEAEAQLASLVQQCAIQTEERDQLTAEMSGLEAERIVLRAEVQALRRTLLSVVQGEDLDA
jgi:transposase-like protein